jgi:cytochrome P450
VTSAEEALGRLVGGPGRADPYPLYEVLRSQGPVYRAAPEWFAVVGWQQADAVLRDPAFLVEDVARLDRSWPQWRDHASMRLLSASLLVTNSPTHERLRRLAAGAFTARRVAGLRAAVSRLAGECADRLADGGPVDFVAEFAFPLPIAVICELLGIPPADRDWFRPRAAALTEALEFVAADDLGPADRAADELSDYFLGLVAERGRHPGDDLTSALVAAHRADPGQLSARELLANLAILLVAGFETTTNLLGSGLYALLNHPRELAALRAEPDRVGRVVEEMLRYDSPVQLTSRTAGTDRDLAGFRVPAGAAVLVLLGAANRDPLRFTDPDRFDPDRPGNQSLSFGAGAHFCLGAALARLEAQVAFPALLRRFGRLELAGEPTRRDRLTLRGLRTLPVSVSGQ